MASLPAAHNAAADVVSAFYFTGNGYVSGDQTQTLTPAGGYTLTANENFENGASLRVIQTAGTNYWDLDFGAAGNQLLAPGSYANATRYPFNQGADVPTPTNGLSFTGDGRGDNQLTGEFYVFDIQYGALQGRLLRSPPISSNTTKTRGR